MLYKLSGTLSSHLLGALAPRCPRLPSGLACSAASLRPPSLSFATFCAPAN